MSVNSVKGFRLTDGSTAKYDYAYLENIITDKELTEEDVAADGKAVGDAIEDVIDELNDVKADLNDNLSIMQNYDDGIKRFPGEFVFGTLNTQGEIQEFAAHTRCVSVDYYIASAEYLTLDNGYSIILCEYNNDEQHTLINRRIITSTDKISLTSGHLYRVCIWKQESSSPQTSPYQFASKAHLETNTEKRFDGLDSRLDGIDTSIQNAISESKAYTDSKALTLGLVESAIVTGGYIPTNINPVDITDIRTDSAFGYLVETCNTGDVFHITGTGGSGGRLYCFVDTNGAVLNVADASTTLTEQTIVAPVGSTHLVINVRLNNTYKVYKLLPFDKVLIKPATEEFKYGDIRNGSVFVNTKKAVITADFIDTSMIDGIVGIDSNYKYAVGVFIGSKHVRTDYWYTANQKYTFTDGYNYLVYVKTQDEAEMYDFDDPVNAVRYIVSVSYMQSQYNNAIVSLDEIKKDYNESLKKIMLSHYDISFANANNPIALKSYFGNNQNVHPKVLYFPNLFGNHKYWMAYTPYPWNDSYYENPCIAYSDDGYTWENIEGNPLDDPAGVGYNSDTHLLYRSDTNTLEVWYRYVSDYDTTDPVTETIYRQTSTDGITWTQKEQVYYNNSGRHSDCLSPCAIWDGEKYLVWWINWSEKKIKFYNVSSALQFTWIRDINLTYSANGINYDAWHLDVIIDNGLYIALVMCKEHNLTRGAWSLFLTTSEDNAVYSTPALVMAGSNGWDEYMYRSSIVKVGDIYRIYYSALDYDYVHGIGISESETLDDFIGQITG